MRLLSCAVHSVEVFALASANTSTLWTAHESRRIALTSLFRSTLSDQLVDCRHEAAFPTGFGVKTVEQP